MTGSHPGLGIALVVLMSACFAAMDTTVKYAGGLLPLLAVLLARYGTQATVMAGWLAISSRRGGAGLRSAHPRFQALRGTLLLSSSAFGFLALRHLPVAEFTAIAMLTPVLVTLLSGWLLHEPVSPLRWLLVVGGMSGALIVIRPGSGLFGWSVLLPLAAALSYALFQVMTRKMAGLESPYTTHFWTGCVGSAILLAAALVSGGGAFGALAAAPPWLWGVLLGIGVLGTAGHLMLVVAFGLAPTATLMPFTYLQIAFAALIGWLVFRQVPDGWGFVGMAVIAACGAASAWLNMRESQAARVPVSALSADSMLD